MCIDSKYVKRCRGGGGQVEFEHNINANLYSYIVQVVDEYNYY